MVTMSKSSGTLDTLRSGAGYAVSGDSGRALANATETWFAAAAECQREMMGCRNPADMTAIQSRWVEETLRDYNAEMGKLMTILTKSVNGGGGTGR
jgi:hypothetical protein